MKNTSIKRKNFPKEFFKLEDTSSSSEKRTTAEFKVDIFICFHDFEITCNVKFRGCPVQ